MKKTIFSVIMLAIVGVCTITTLSACSDDDDNKKDNGDGITINGVDQVEYFRQFLGAFTKNDILGTPFRMKAIDKLTPTVYSYFVEDEKEAETLFLTWIPQEARKAVVRNGNTIVYTPRDAQGAKQGTITFRAALPSETATFAVVEFKDVSKIKGIDKIKFQPESANPDNMEFGGVPQHLTLEEVKSGNWFWGKVQKGDFFDYPYGTRLYYSAALPKLITGKELIEKMGDKFWYSNYAFESFCIMTSLDTKFNDHVCDNFNPGDHKIIIEAGKYFGGDEIMIKTAEIYINKTYKDIMISECDPPVDEAFESLDESEQYWVCQGYIVDYKSGMSY